jgi:transcriptional regulator with XRE-family HTH domain
LVEYRNMGTRQTPKRPAWDYTHHPSDAGHQQRLARNNPHAPSRVVATMGAVAVALSFGARGKDSTCNTMPPPRSPERQALIDAADARRRADNLARDRARTHNPIRPDEIGPLEQLGAHVKRLRQQAGLTQCELANLADRHSTFVVRIERGSRRARLDTLRAIAAALAGCGVGFEAEELTVQFASIAVAPESVWERWPERMATRRAKKRRRQELEDQRYMVAVRKVQDGRPEPLLRPSSSEGGLR